VQPRCWTVFSRPTGVRLSTPSTWKVQQTMRKVAQNVLARDFADCGLSLLQSSMMQLRFTRCCGAVSFATQVSVALAVLFSVKEILNSKTMHSLPLKKAIRIALQQVSWVKVGNLGQLAPCSSFLRFPTHSRQLKHASIHTAITEISMQISFHTHFSTARKITSDVFLLTLKILMLERFGIYILPLCI